MRGGRRLALTRAAAAALAIWAAPLRADEITLRYDAHWAGFPAADIHLRLVEAGDAYRSEIDIRTQGLVRLLSRFKARAFSEGGRSGVGLAAPTRYEADYEQRGKRKRAALHFVGMGDVALAEKGAGDTGKPSKVPEALRRGVVDPIAALADIRARLRDGSAPAGGARIPVYDGKRRFDVEIRSVERASVPWGRARLAAVKVGLMLLPVAGFDRDADDDEDPENRPRAVELLLTDDARLLPLRVEVSIVYFAAVITLRGECAATTPCEVSF